MSVTFRVNKTPMEKRKQNSIRLFAIILMLFSVCWGGYHIKLFFDYHFTSTLFLLCFRIGFCC